MILSQREKNIIGYVQHRAELSVTEIARNLGLTESVVRRSLRRLTDESILVRRAYIDLYRLGFSKHAFFFSLGSREAAARRDVLQYLHNHRRVAYVAEVGGDFRFKADICTCAQAELRDFYMSFSEKFGDILREKAFVQLLEQVELGVKCLSKQKLPIQTLAMGISSDIVAIDETDEIILALLSEIGTKSYADLARIAGIPATTFQYRVDILRKKRVLLGFRYVVNGKALGLNDYFHLVYVKGLREETRERLFSFCREHPEVRYFVPCIGAWDFEIGSNSATAEAAVELADHLLEVGGNSISRIQTLPLFRFSKVSNYPLNQRKGRG
jgi:DNA-binding Lrp family transcriptional regulator